MTLSTIEKRYPNAAYYDVRMIAAAMRIPTRTVQYHCKKCFPLWSGHYRFAVHDVEADWLLSHNSLEWLIECLAQQKERQVVFKK